MAKHAFRAVLNPGGPGRIRILASIADRPGWDVEVLVLLTENGPSVRELKVRPHNGPDGTQWQTQGWEMPEGGISTRLIRDINVGELIDIARDCARAEEDKIKAVAGNPAPDLDLDPGFRKELAAGLHEQAKMMRALSREKKRTGPRGNGIDHYLKWACLYAQKVAAGVRNPNAELARESGNTPEYVRDTITDARRRYELLTASPGRGRAGGTLTPKALDLIARRKEN
jgi:hypothetical protein